TRIGLGTDVNFGNLTRSLFSYLGEQPGVNLHLNNEVTHIGKDKGAGWHITVKDRKTHAHRELKAKFVFIGAGGGALLLLEKAGIPEAKGFGGFPVSGQWLICNNEEIIK